MMGLWPLLDARRVVAPMGPQTLVLQPNAAAGKDGRTVQALPTNNYGASSSGALAGALSTAAILLLNAQNLVDLPVGSNVLSATLEMVVSATHGSQRTIDVHHMIANLDWVEGTGAAAMTNDGVTWNTKDGVTAWAGGANGGGALGTDIATVPIGTTTYEISDPIGTVLVWDLDTNVVAAHAGGWINFVMRRPDSSTGGGPTLNFSDTSTAVNRPKLTIVYEAPTTIQVSPTRILIASGTTNGNGLLRNPLSGLHKWNGFTRLPLPGSHLDEYDRNYWNVIETGTGAVPSGQTFAQSDYTWTSITNQIAALPAGAKFAWRFQAQGSSGGTTQRLPTRYQNTTYSVLNANGVWIPDYTKTVMLDRMIAATKAYVAQFGASGKHSFFDVGWMGHYSEWTGTIPLSALQYVFEGVKAAWSAYPDVYIMCMGVSVAFWDWVRVAYPDMPNLGMRVDSFGNQAASDQSYGKQSTATRAWIDARMASTNPLLLLGEFWNQHSNAAQTADSSIAASQRQDRPENGFDYGYAQMTGGFQYGNTINGSAAAYRLIPMATLGNGNINPKTSSTWPGSAGLEFTTQDQIYAYDAVKKMGHLIWLESATFSRLVAGGSCTVTLRWHNDGASPPYDPYLIKLELWNSANTSLLWSSDFADTLRVVRPDRYTASGYTEMSKLFILTGVTKATHTVRLRIYDPRTPYARPLYQIYTQTRQVDGSYVLGTVPVV